MNVHTADFLYIVENFRYNVTMSKREKFPYDVEMGAQMDFADGRFMLVLKDEDWSEEELAMARSFLNVAVCYTNGICIFVLEGGDIDSSDFYFNIQECDEKDALLSADPLRVDVYLLDKDNGIALHKSKDLPQETGETVKQLLQNQLGYDFMPGEYDVNVEGLQSAYEPFELRKFEKAKFRI